MNLRRWGLRGAKNMSALGVTVFRGASGRAYHFHACHLNANLKSVGAIYALTKRTKGDVIRIFTESFTLVKLQTWQRLLLNHRKSTRVAQFNGNCVCIQLEKSEEQRKKKIADISQYYSKKNENRQKRP